MEYVSRSTSNHLARFCILVFCTWLLQACSGINVFETKSASRSLSSAKTYAWQSRPVTTSPLMQRFDEAVRKSVNKQLQQHGYQLAANDQADFLVDYRFKEIQASTSAAGDDVGYGGWQRDNDGMNFVGWQNDPTMAEYPVGVLNLALLNAKDNKELWATYGSKMLDEVRDIDNIEKNVERVVKRLFADFNRKASKD